MRLSVYTPILSMALTLVLSACGGGGGGDSAQPPSPNPVTPVQPGCVPGAVCSPTTNSYRGTFTITNSGLYAAFIKEYTMMCTTGFWGGGNGSGNNCFSYMFQGGTVDMTLPTTLVQGTYSQIVLTTKNPGTYWAPLSLPIPGYFYARGENQGFTFQAPGRSGYPGSLSWNKTIILESNNAPIDPNTGRITATKFDFVLYYKSKYGKQEMARGTFDTSGVPLPPVY